jgi:hypothetical protein
MESDYVRLATFRIAFYAQNKHLLATHAKLDITYQAMVSVCNVIHDATNALDQTNKTASTAQYFTKRKIHLS